jgi:glyceraldehyde 3-phosphate dehydrogenase
VSWLDEFPAKVRALTLEQVNAAVKKAAEGKLKGILRYTTDPIVSSDVLGDPASCVLDSGLTLVSDDLVKVFGWYDNEWGYAQRTVALVELVARTLPDR